MRFDPQSPSDRADMEPDAPVIDWNGKLYVNKPMPRDRYFWIVTDDAQTFYVTFWEDNFAWTGNVGFHTEPDELTVTFTEDEILGWTESQEDAEEAAELLLKAGDQ